MSKSTKSADGGRSQPEMVQIIVYGTRFGVEQMLREFYLCRFSEVSDWTMPQPVPQQPQQVMITYKRRLR